MPSEDLYDWLRGLAWLLGIRASKAWDKDLSEAMLVP
jgi:hypothetical protein